MVRIVLTVLEEAILFYGDTDKNGPQKNGDTDKKLFY